jgi:serine/threonine protein phosphatase 1
MKSLLQLKVSDYRNIYYTPDIHGVFTELLRNLKNLGFDFEKDLLITTGDLIDRGPESNLALHFLKQSWFKSTLGNHELIFIDDPHEEFFSSSKAIKMFEKLPLAIELVSPTKTIGFVHAHVPHNNWNIFKISKLPQKICLEAIWSRTKIKNHFDTGAVKSPPVLNIDYVFHGHTVVPTVHKIANAFYCDTGSCFRKSPFNHKECRMTIINITQFLETGDVNSATQRYA